MWTFGGTFFQGTARNVNPEILSAFQDVIVVTFNYRLGVLGFLAKFRSELKGNYALFDQRLVIQWVKDNIAAFGGDGSSITLYGQSSGAFMVTYQTVSPLNNASLFQRAITQSGSGLSIQAATVNPDPVADQIISSVDCTNASSLLDCLQNVPMFQLLLATTSPTGSLLFTPVVDGDIIAADLPLQIASFVSSGYTTNFTMNLGNFGDYDLMSGWNTNDGSTFIDVIAYVNSLFTRDSIGSGVSEQVLLAALEAIADPESRQSSFLRIFLNTLINYNLNTAAASNTGGESDGRLRLQAFMDISG